MRLPRLPRLAVAVAALALTAGCAGDGAGRGDGDGVAVVAGLAPLAEVAARVAGEGADVSDLTPAGAEPHDLELDARQVEALGDADVVVLVGGGFQPAAERAAGQAGGRVVTLADLVPSDRDEAVDPHVWLDPVLLSRAADAVAEALAAADPAGRDGYEARAAALRADLGALDARYRQALRHCARRTIVTAHQAFGHLAARYGLREEGISGRSPEREPDPRRLAAVAALVREEGLTTVFTEPLLGQGLARTVAGETGAVTAVLDPVESLRPPDTYFTVMDRNLAALSAALGCGAGEG